jgi:TonB family protein
MRNIRIVGNRVQLRNPNAINSASASPAYSHLAEIITNQNLTVKYYGVGRGQSVTVDGSRISYQDATKKVEAKYPIIAKQAKAQGTVEVRIIVDRVGNVVDACVIEGHPLLGPAAKEAALQWKFKKNFGFTHKQKGYIQTSIFFTFRPERF